VDERDEQQEPIRVGVRLDPRPDNLTEWLIDGQAFEAAGAEALWIPDTDSHDPLVLGAALAVVTHRALLIAAGPEGPALRTLTDLCRGRLRVVVDGSAGPDGTAEHEGTPAPDGTAERTDGIRCESDTLSEVAEPGRTWLTVPAPENRAAWRVTVADAVERGYTRLMVPANPRLLDLLRNPEDPGERLDLHLAQG
jgi:hypothetical protein